MLLMHVIKHLLLDVDDKYKKNLVFRTREMLYTEWEPDSTVDK